VGAQLDPVFGTTRWRPTSPRRTPLCASSPATTPHPLANRRVKGYGVVGDKARGQSRRQARQRQIGPKNACVTLSIERSRRMVTAPHGRGLLRTDHMVWRTRITHSGSLPGSTNVQVAPARPARSTALGGRSAGGVGTRAANNDLLAKPDTGGQRPPEPPRRHEAHGTPARRQSGVSLGEHARVGPLEKGSRCRRRSRARELPGRGRRRLLAISRPGWPGPPTSINLPDPRSRPRRREQPSTVRAAGGRLRRR